MVAKSSRGKKGLIEDDPVTKFRDYVEVGQHDVKNSSSSAFPRNYGGIDDAWDLADFKKNFKIDIISIDEERIEFDMIGVDAAIANAFRRILLAEVPTMAIENVYIFQNTSIIPDEILAHRLGLIPFKVDPRPFEWLHEDEDGQVNDQNTLVFVLEVQCSHNKNADKNATTAKEKYINSNVYSKQLEWVPQGTQEEWLDGSIGPVHEKILIAKLRPGQKIHTQLHLRKGVGREHAKFSPVCTASYRLLPIIELTEEITGDEADKLQKCFPEGVIGIEGDSDDDNRRAFVQNARLDTMSREVFRHPEFVDKVKIYRRRDHFIFSVESTGVHPPAVLVEEAIKVLMKKCDTVLASIAEMEDGEEN